MKKLKLKTEEKMSSRRLAIKQLKAEGVIPQNSTAQSFSVWKLGNVIADRLRIPRPRSKHLAQLLIFREYPGQRSPEVTRVAAPHQIQQNTTHTHLRRTFTGNLDPTYHPSLKTDFYDSIQWKELRVDILRRDGRRCVCCGSTPQTGAVLHVDHIIPLSQDWSRRWDPNNLQVLCGDCNHGKGNRYSDDWRR